MFLTVGYHYFKTRMFLYLRDIHKTNENFVKKKKKMQFQAPWALKKKTCDTQYFIQIPNVHMYSCY